jgi:adenine/guanine phosphoribosyltransferase-like PRPP-binding protein
MSVRAMYYGINENKQKFIIDNVIASGVTASAALEAIPEAMVCAIAKA